MLMDSSALSWPHPHQRPLQRPLTTVHRGVVDVHDFGTRKTIPVHAGHSYLAKALRNLHS
jgi:hypothetical protein